MKQHDEPTGHSEVREYLLGRLSGERLERLDDALFGDAAMLENLETVRSELIEEYVGGSSDQLFRTDFERTVLLTRDAQREMLVVRALRAEYDRPREKTGLFPWLDWTKWTGTPALAACLAAAALISVLYVLSQSRQLNEYAAREQQLRARIARTDERLRQLEARSQPSPAAKPTLTAGVVAFMLRPDIGTRNVASETGPVEVSLSSEAHQVDLTVKPATEPGLTYSAFITRGGAARLWTSAPQTASKEGLTFRVPASALSEGAHRLTLLSAAAGEKPEVHEQYAFVVRRQRD